MKKSLVLFVGSLGLNAILLGWFVARRAEVPAATGDKIVPGSTVMAAADPTNPVRREIAGSAGPADKVAANTTTLWASLDSADLPTLIARLRAAGFPANLIREIVSGRIDAHFATRMKEIAAKPSDRPYWKTERLNPFGPQNYEAMSQLYRERARMLREALADPFFVDAPLGGAELERRRQFGSLPKDKADAVQRIADDYAEMTTKINAAMGGIRLPEDKEQLALLEREKRADLAAVLTPQELEDYEMRTSPVTSRLRTALTLMDATEEEFRAIYAMQRAQTDSRESLSFSGPVSGANWQEVQRLAAEQAKALKAALGEARYADYERSSDREFQQLNQIAQRENVSREATLQAYNLRETTTRESNRIFDDATLTTEQKRAALQALAQNTKTQMRNTLGQAAGDAYIQSAGWVKALENGQAVSFSAGGGTRMRSLPVAKNVNP
ncbi:MAG TPA: hypothetical protein VIM71_00430 [Lacunisphaera sp.]